MPARALIGPDFLVVGAQRAGTTWLYAALEPHPDLWLPPIKELHYFDEPSRNPRFARHLRSRVSSTLRLRRPLPLWDARYFLGRRGDQWYCRLFDPGRRLGRLAGEITPAYATLDETAFARIRSLNPAMKVIFVMRDPVARSWSGVMNYRKKHPRNGQLTLDESLALATRESALARSCYAGTVARLARLWPADQLWFGFFEDLTARPAAFLTKLLTFMSVDSSQVERLLPRGPVNVAAGSQQPPPGFERAMAERLLPDLRRLCDHVDGPPHDWCARCERLAGDPPILAAAGR